MKKRIYPLAGMLAGLCMSLPAVAQEPLPLFTKYVATDYNAHSVNQDIQADTLGRVYAANFEGLLIYDGTSFTILHTPGITSISDVKLDNRGRIWALGKNYLGYATGGGINEPWVLHTVQSDNGGQEEETEVPTEIQEWRDRWAGLAYTELGETSVWNGYTVADTLITSYGNTFIATVNHGIFETDADGRVLYNLTAEDGLNSNSVNSIATDGKNSVWCATDDGIFRITLSPALSSFTVNQGLKGDVTAIYRHTGNFYAGTMHGLFINHGSRFTQIEGIQFACWQLGDALDGSMYAATANGVYLVNGEKARRLTQTHTLSVVFIDSQTFLTGELDGIYRNTLSGQRIRIASLPNITELTVEPDGAITARNIGNQCYTMPAGQQEFGLPRQESVAHKIDYTDSQGVRWITDSEGRNIQCSVQDCNDWLYSLNTTTIRCVYRDDGYVWLGCNKGLIRFNVQRGAETEPLKPHLLLRSFEINGRNLSFSMAVDKYDALDGFMYSYRLNDEWTDWNDDNNVTLSGLAPGYYTFQARVKDLYGHVSDIVEMKVDIPYPLYMRWYMNLLYVAIFFYVIKTILDYRARKRMLQMKEQNDMLETLVAERTSELKKAHAELVRKEKEATVGKLTKGLIDRILNPMNYINNFSHLTLGLIKDLKADVEDEEEHMSEDNYEDAMDVLDMMGTNLQKIEAHGQSTTRILKAMEEMLKDRSGAMVPVNLTQLCQQADEMLHAYFKEAIEKHHIQVDVLLPDMALTCKGIAEQLIKCVMSLLGNSVYAVQKRAATASTGYQPVIRLQLQQVDDQCQIQVYDNGVGMEESIKDKIFDPFFTNKPTAEAAGVGLYLTREIIETHGGTITVDSAQDHHTELIISLPHVTV